MPFSELNILHTVLENIIYEKYSEIVLRGIPGKVRNALTYYQDRESGQPRFTKYSDQTIVGGHLRNIMDICSTQDFYEDTWIRSCLVEDKARQAELEQRSSSFSDIEH